MSSLGRRQDLLAFSYLFFSLPKAVFPYLCGISCSDSSGEGPTFYTHPGEASSLPPHLATFVDVPQPVVREPIRHSGRVHPCLRFRVVSIHRLSQRVVTPDRTLPFEPSLNSKTPATSGLFTLVCSPARGS